MENAVGLINLKIVFNTIPSIESTIIGANNEFEKGRTNSSIKPSTNNIIKSLPLRVFVNRFSRIIGNNMSVHKVSLIMEFEESNPSIKIRALIIKLNGYTCLDISI